jgi:hypothetical protein
MDTKVPMPHMHCRLRQQCHGGTPILSEEEKEKRGEENFEKWMPLKSRAKSVGHPTHVLAFSLSRSCSQPGQSFESPELPLALEAEVPTCRGSIPMRNFKSRASSTSNLASHDTTPGLGFALCCQPTT